MIEDIAEKLKNDDYSVRRNAVHRLRSLHNEVALHFLLIAIHDADEFVRWEAIVALGDYPQSTDAVQAVIAALRDDEADNRVTAASTLGWMKNPLAIKPLIDVLLHGEEKIRDEAADSLGEIDGVESLEPLTISMKTDPSLEVRQSAAYALANISLGDATVNKAAYNILVDTAQNDPYPNTRLIAEQALRES